MSFISAPPVAAFDPHSPGSFGDVTPGTVGATVVTAGNGTLSTPTYALRVTQGLFSPYSGYVGFTDGSTMGLLVQAGTGQLAMTSIGVLSWTSSTSSSDGATDTVIARAGPNMLAIGGTTSSFPAIKRSGTTLAFRLADDSADAPITAASITFTGGKTLSGDSSNIIIVTGVGLKFGNSVIYDTSNALVIDDAFQSGIFLGADNSNNVKLIHSAGLLKFRNGADNAFNAIQGKLTTDTTAATGLTAGVLSALTTASIVIYDSTGQAYRVPCVI